VLLLLKTTFSHPCNAYQFKLCTIVFVIGPAICLTGNVLVWTADGSIGYDCSSCLDEKEEKSQDQHVCENRRLYLLQACAYFAASTFLGWYLSFISASEPVMWNALFLPLCLMSVAVLLCTCCHPNCHEWVEMLVAAVSTLAFLFLVSTLRVLWGAIFLEVRVYFILSAALWIITCCKWGGVVMASEFVASLVILCLMSILHVVLYWEWNRDTTSLVLLMLTSSAAVCLGVHVARALTPLSREGVE
jgi:hypothetical protein